MRREVTKWEIFLDIIDAQLLIFHTQTVEILDRGFQVDKKEAVHPMSLKSWVKEMTENGSEFPSDLFGAFIGKKAKIVKGK
jgi:hypothetical protein